MKTFEEIKATATKETALWLIGDNGERYDAVYDPAFELVFFCMPASVGIVGFIEK